MNIRRYLPSARFDEAVESYTLLEMDPACMSQPVRMLPPLSVSLCLHYGGQVIAGYRNEMNLVRSALTGLHTEPRSYAPHERLGIVLVTFRPGAVGQFFRVHADELLHLNVSLSDLIARPDMERIEEELSMAAGDAERVQQAERFLVRLRTGNAADLLAQRAAKVLASSGGAVTIAQLAALHHVSERQLERRFTRAIGMTPKKFARLARFHQLLGRLGESSSVADLAASCGYYDQSHLLKDCRQFSGGLGELLPQGAVTELILAPG